MANTLTNLIPDFYKQMDIVSRELVGFIPSLTLDADVARAAVGQNVRSFETRTPTAGDITPGVTVPNDGDQTVDNTPLSITKARSVRFRWTGEEERGLNNGGAGSRAIKGDQLQQAIRVLVNEIEADCYAAARIAASRAYGTAGTTPFASDLSDTANLRKIFDDNGAPMGSRTLVINTTAGVNLRKQAQLTKANEAGTTMTLRDGALLDLHGFVIKESAVPAAVTKGTGTLYQLNGAHAVGATTLNVDTGSGTILAGDIITIANGTPADTNKYVVATALSGGVLTICKPGLLCAHVDNDAITVGNNFTPNVAFHQSSLVLAVRAPALPEDGDGAADRMVLTDPRTGIPFELALWPQYRQISYEISCAWGVKGIKSAHAAILLG